MTEDDTDLDNTGIGAQDTGASPQDALGGDLGASVTGDGEEASSVVVGGGGEDAGYAGSRDVNAYSNVTRTVAGRHGGRLIPFDSARAREMNLRRWDAVGRAARAGVGDAAGQIPGLNKGDAMGMLRATFEQHALHAYDPSARGSQSSLRTLLDTGWPSPDRGKGDAPAPASGLSSEQEQALAEIADRYIQYKARASGDDV